METRLDYGKAAPGSVQAMYKLQKYVDDSGLEHSLLELVKTRVSQINGCAYCVDMHTKDARAAGETEQRLYGLSAWREAPYYSERERAALAWAEVVTLISQTHASDEEYEAARAVQRGGARQADDGYHRHQRLEPPRHRLPAGSREVPAARERRVANDFDPTVTRGGTD